MQLRLPNGSSTEFEVTARPPVEPRFFFGLCPVSLTTANTKNNDMKACSGCLSVCYAGKEEQKKDWKRHKALCKVLQPLIKKGEGNHHPLSGHPEKNGQIQMLLQTALRRELSQYESDMFVYPRLCMVCLSGDQSALRNCPDCHCVAYCCMAHKLEDEEEHEKSCHLLKISLQDYVVSRTWGHPVLKYNFSPTFQGGNFAAQSITLEIPDFFQSQTKKEEQEAEQLYETELRYLTYHFSCQLSVLYGLEQAAQGQMVSLKSRKKLTLHVVGARKAESEDLARWEVFAARLPNLKNLNVIFVGPELSCPYPVDGFFWESQSAKEFRPDLKVRYQFIKAAYHEVVKRLATPDCVAALNCGFVFYPLWDASMPKLVDLPGVPLVFTEYYLEDCQLNLQKLEDLIDYDLDISVEPTVNPYCSQLPARIPTGFAFRKFKRRNVVMSNDFICVVMKPKRC